MYSMTNAHSETPQMTVCCRDLKLGALSSHSALFVLVGILFKKFGLFLNTPWISLKTSRSTPPRPLHIFMVCIHTTLPLSQHPYTLHKCSVVYRYGTKANPLHNMCNAPYSKCHYYEAQVQLCIAIPSCNVLTWFIHKIHFCKTDHNCFPEFHTVTS
jgi:hypothetical protein